MRFLFLIALAFAGCAPAPTTTVHGRPASYWLEQLRDGEAGPRRQAIRMLANAAAADPAVVPALIGALDDPEPAVRKEAVLALLKAGPLARDATAALEKCRQDPDAEVRIAAERALQRIGGRP
jgi:HEAT repeat protein